MQQDFFDQKALRDRLLEQLRDARLRLEFTRSFLEEIREDVRAGSIPPPDGCWAYRQALRAETAALVEYRRVLASCSDFLRHGNLAKSVDGTAAR